MAFEQTFDTSGGSISGNDLLSDFRHAQDEFTMQLIDAIAPPILQGMSSIVDEAVRLCEEKGEPEMYLKTFQNMLARIPGWNAALISQEVDRITEAAQIGYLPDLVTAVHIIHLRILSSVRVGHKPKRIEIDPPDFDQFIHRVYCEAGRKMWTYAYLFQRDLSDLDRQRNMHECEKIVRECVLTAVRASLPVETILRAYIDEAEEIRLAALEEAKASLVDEDESEDSEDSGNGKDIQKGKKVDSDVESEVKRIKATGLPVLGPAVADDDEDDEDDDDGPSAERDSDDVVNPTKSLSVGFAEKNEVLDMGTNRRNEIKMQPVPPSPIPPTGPPLELVSTKDLLSTQPQRPSTRLIAPTPAPSPPSPIASPTPRLPLAGDGLQDVTAYLGELGSAKRPTLHLDTSPF
jgi:hypothetical protein